MPETNGATSNALRVLYLGPSASFSNAAALAVFPNAQLTPLPSFSSIFAALQSNQSYDFAVLPIENSTNGSVVQVLDLLARCPQAYPDLEVCGEHYLAVHHFLYIKALRSPNTEDKHALSKIKTLYTHPQVWGQCSRFLSSHLPPPVERIDVSSTSKAASLVAAEDNDGAAAAAICSSLAGEQNGLHCVASHIEDEPDKNTTRFFVLRNRKHSSLFPSQLTYQSNSTTRTNTTATVKEETWTNIKSLITFTVPHTTPGSLSSALRVFADHRFNLTRIDTRPSGHQQQSWHYIFFIECEKKRESGTGDDGNLERMVEALRKVTETVWVGGSWRDERQ